LQAEQNAEPAVILEIYHLNLLATTPPLFQ
jgi:hypothetical protein